MTVPAVTGNVSPKGAVEAGRAHCTDQFDKDLPSDAGTC